MAELPKASSLVQATEALSVADPQAKSCYIDPDNGADDETADGSETRPFKSLGFAYIYHIDNPTPKYLQRSAPAAGEAADSSPWKEPGKSAIKKAQQVLDRFKVKRQKQLEAEALLKENREKALAAAADIKVVEDTSLPAPTRIRLYEKNVELGKRVKVSGRIHRLRAQKAATFLVLTDGFGFLQCILEAGNLTKSRDALLFAQGTSLELYGTLKEVPQTQHAPDNRELLVDYYKVYGHSPSDADALTNRVASSQNPWDAAMLDNRHLVLRGESASSVIKVRSAVELAFIQVLTEMRFTKVSPPALVQTQVEGGSTLFTVPYYNETAYLTQSSQLYLETCLASMGNVFALEKSFRAEKSLSKFFGHKASVLHLIVEARRHLSEYTHLEGELDYITLDELLDHIEDLICRVIDKVLADKETAGYISALNPGFQKPQRPFVRMRYSDAIKWLNEHDILNEDEKPHTMGDDIAEAAERKMTDIINKPIFLTHFPAALKAFYMKRDPEDNSLTESSDLLMPGVGEIVGGSMRAEDYDALMAAYDHEGIPSKDYFWYTDQRKYGTSPHGGYGLGLERFLAWLCGQHTVRTTCLYPRFMGRCKP